MDGLGASVFVSILVFRSLSIAVFVSQQFMILILDPW